MAPFVIGRDPWNREAMQADLFTHGLWQFRTGTGNFAWAGVDMALYDLVRHARSASRCTACSAGSVATRCRTSTTWRAAATTTCGRSAQQGVAQGYETFYLKVGIDPEADIAMVATVREALGPGPRLRLDANGTWSVPDALRILGRMAAHDIDLVEQPVRDHPIGQLAEVRARLPMAVCANEGMWSEADAYARIRARQADVYCFSPYWVGSIGAFHRLAHVAHLEGLQVCKHTHGELGLAAAASHHVLLTLPNIVEGHQQTAHVMAATS